MSNLEIEIIEANSKIRMLEFDLRCEKERSQNIQTRLDYSQECEKNTMDLLQKRINGTHWG